jgi:hypothetical protein
MSRVSQHISGDLVVEGLARKSDGRRFLLEGDVPETSTPSQFLDLDDTPLTDLDGIALEDLPGGLTVTGVQVITHIQSTPLQLWAIAWPWTVRPAGVQFVDGENRQMVPRWWWDPNASMVWVKFSIPRSGVGTLLLQEDPANALN